MDLFSIQQFFFTHYQDILVESFIHIGKTQFPNKCSIQFTTSIIALTIPDMVYVSYLIFCKEKIEFYIYASFHKKHYSCHESWFCSILLAFYLFQCDQVFQPGSTHSNFVMNSFLVTRRILTVHQMGQRKRFNAAYVLNTIQKEWIHVEVSNRDHSHYQNYFNVWACNTTNHHWIHNLYLLLSPT